MVGMYASWFFSILLKPLILRPKVPADFKLRAAKMP
jgi:hypothetical protein